MRSVTGSTHLLTRCRPIVFIEGQRAGGRRSSDQRLIEVLIPEAAGWVTAPASGKGQSVSNARVLREAARDEMPGLPVFALVDADQRTTDLPDWVIAWPVAMVENLLLDANAIWDFLTPHRERVSVGSAADVDGALRRIARERRAEEIRLRTTASIPPLWLFVSASDEESAGEAEALAHEALTAHFAKHGGVTALQASLAAAAALVDSILATGDELERFHGKLILEEFRRTHCSGLHLPEEIFVYEIARHARDGARLRQLVAKPVAQIRGYVPGALVEALTQAGEVVMDEERHASLLALKRDVQVARHQWENGELAPRVDRDHLRRRVFELAHELAAHPAVHDPLLYGAVELGSW